jgi:hypothetical protein
MLESMLGKVVSGVVSFASLAFSSFKGNEATISTPVIAQSSSQIVIDSNLHQAFDNDFEEFFRSGKEIRVWFVLTVESGQNRLFERYFVHKVNFDPMSRQFHVYLQEQDYSLNTRNYSEMLSTVSHFEYPWTWRDNAHPGQTVNVKVSSHLETIKLDAYKKDFDLNMLWKYQRPHCAKTIRINNYDS